MLEREKAEGMPKGISGNFPGAPAAKSLCCVGGEHTGRKGSD